jgi:hypothetical protein
MKIIDHTPFFNKETGEISILDRGRAMLKYGAGWIKETEAQNLVIPVLEKVLDRSYTLLRNVTPPGLEASIPLILVGPAGVFVLYVTHLTGIYRAKGDQWGTISGNTFKNEKPNLLTRIERMARAIQIYLRRQGFLDLVIVEAILLCSDPTVHVDSIRPIIRVVMRDALERFAISMMQARVALSPDSVQDVIQRILNPPTPVPPEPSETIAVAEQEEPAETFVMADPEVPASNPIKDQHVPPFAFPESQPPLEINEPAPLLVEETQTPPRIPISKKLNKKQWAFLLVMFGFWCFLIAFFLFIVIKDQWSFLLRLLP